MPILESAFQKEVKRLLELFELGNQVDLDLEWSPM